MGYFDWLTGDDSPLRVANWPDLNSRATEYAGGLAADQAMQVSPLQPADDIPSAMKSLPDVYSPFAQRTGIAPATLGRSLGVQADVPPAIQMLAGTVKRMGGALDAARGKDVAPSDSFPQPQDAGTVMMAAGAAEPLAGLARRLGVGEDAVSRAVGADTTLGANRVATPGVFGSNFAKLGYGDDIWHHGTTFDVKAFDDPSLPKNWNEEMGNNGRYFTGNYDGPAIYATNAKGDALGNYSRANSPDLSGKIERMADILEAANGISPNAAKAIATKQYYGGQDNVLDLRVHKDLNPAIIDPYKPYRGAIGDGETLYGSWDEDDNHVPNLDGDKLHELMRQHFEGVPHDVTDRVFSQVADDPTWHHLDKYFHQSDAPMYLWDNGMTPPGMAFQNIVKGMGHDAVLRKNAELTFKGMGLSPDTNHLAMFTNKGIRRVEAAYDPAHADSVDLLAANKAGAAAALSPKRKEER
jgi:hypothetical protein